MERVRFDDRVAVVTGAGRGLGERFARLLAARGAAVVVNDLRRADIVAQSILDAGGAAVASFASVAEPEGASSIVDLAIDAFGRVDIVINNAGVLVLEPFERTTLDDFARTWSVHVAGAWNVTHAAWPHMRTQGGGRVLMVSSANGVVLATPDHAAYGAAKGALVGLTRELALEGEPFGIHVNALLPGAATSMLAQNPVTSKPTIPMAAELVAPGACWLVHDDCPATGSMYVCSSGRIAEVFTAVSAGFQSLVAELSLESVRDHWHLANDRSDFNAPRSIDEYNAYRTKQFVDAGNHLSTAPE